MLQVGVVDLEFKTTSVKQDGEKEKQENRIKIQRIDLKSTAKNHDATGDMRLCY